MRTAKRRRAIGLAALSLAISSASASTGGAAPSTNSPASTLQFFKGYSSSLGKSGSQTYSVTSSDRCEDLVKKTRLGWYSSDGKTTLVDADRSVIILVSTVYYLDAGNLTASMPHCERRGTFTPAAGHRYKISSTAPLGGECDLQVTDLETGQSPEGLTVEDGAKCLRASEREKALRKGDSH